MQLRQVHLNDKYTLESGQAYMTGIQALVRLPMVQWRLDLARGWNTAGFVSGYRGSPLGTLDQQMQLARSLLKDHQIRFQAGFFQNEVET